MSKKYNHIYPDFHIQKWINNGGKIYNKNTKHIRGYIRQHDFTVSYYYSLGEKNSELEDRISVFETYISPLIKKIDQSEKSVRLSAKELEILKL